MESNRGLKISAVRGIVKIKIELTSYRCCSLSLREQFVKRVTILKIAHWSNDLWINGSKRKRETERDFRESEF